MHAALLIAFRRTRARMWRHRVVPPLLRNVNLLRLGINLLRLGMYITAHARKSTGRVCQGPCRRTTSQRANDYTGARTVVCSWRVRRRAIAAAMACARQDLHVRIPSFILAALVASVWSRSNGLVVLQVVPVFRWSIKCAKKARGEVQIICLLTFSRHKFWTEGNPWVNPRMP